MEDYIHHGAFRSRWASRRHRWSRFGGKARHNLARTYSTAPLVKQKLIET